MANQGFVRTLNLSEITDGAQTIQNLAGGTVDSDLRVFAGLSSERSQLLWNRFINTTEINQSVASLKNGTQFIWDTNYTYTDDDYIYIEPVNLLRDFDAIYIGFAEGNSVVSDPLGALDYNYDIGEGYTPGTYNNVALTGGNGSGAKVNLIIGNDGTISSVQVLDLGGTGYSYGDKLLIGDGSGGDGVGFVIRVTAFPWEATAVGNFAWGIEDLDTLNLRVTFDNCSATLDGTYTIAQGASNKNIWGVPNNAVNLAYDINRQITVQEKIENNLDIYDIDGDGSITVQDKTYIEMFINGDDELTFTTYIQNNPVNAGSVRQTGPAIYRYIAGLASSVLDVDGTGVANAVDVSLINSYVTSSTTPKSIYVRQSASNLATGRQSYSNTLKHAISVTAKVPSNPGTKQSLGIGDVYDPPYFYIEKYESNEWKNVYDNFAKYGTAQTCSTTETEYVNNTNVGVLKSEGDIQYRIIDKFVVFDGTQNNYYVRIVASGTGFTNGQVFGSLPTLTATTGVPVFNKNSEYGVFDSDGAAKFYLRTNPRSSVESIKEMVLFSTSYSLSTSESTQYGGTQVPTLTLIPDLVFKRDDSLTLSNIQNLESPEIVDDGENKYSSGFDAFSYGIEGYATELAQVTDNVDESIYLRTTKYRIDRNLYYTKEIKFNGFITSYDPDELNLTQTDLTDELSPGIYISSSLSQITNPLASDYANKTRSFSSDFNPWTAFPAADKLSTQSLNVTINDLVWTTEIEFDIATSSVNGTRFKKENGTHILTQTLGDNFAIDEANPTTYKLKMTINGEVFYLMMKKS